MPVNLLSQSMNQVLVFEPISTQFLLSCCLCPPPSDRSTNTSYQRWDEARKMWGSMVNRSRDFTRQALGYVPYSQPELRSMLVRWSIAYP